MKRRDRELNKKKRISKESGEIEGEKENGRRRENEKKSSNWKDRRRK